ncbi:MAG: RIP metalloprotease RseP [Verrucomicrobiota bacterium]
MSTDLLQSLASNVWAIFLVIFFFGGSIFVHELGHFLAARRRGVFVERFSIGFGPPIWSRRGKDGTEYRLAWFPLGGYVLLPQLADLGALEGESKADVTKLPPPSYSTKMLVFAAGATFNIIFAFCLACIVWAMGQPESSDMASKRIGYVSPTLELPDGSKIPSPALRGGLQAGDIIHAIDGDEVNDWGDIQTTLVLGAGRNKASGQREARFSIERNGVRQDVVVEPVLAGDEKIRRVGISPAFELLVQAVAPDTVGAKAGFKAEDEILRLGQETILNDAAFRAHLDNTAAQPVTAVVRRGGQEVTLTIPPRPELKPGTHLGLTLRTGLRTVHVTPFEQISSVVRWTIVTFNRLVNRNSDIGLEKMSGPVGIARILHSAAEVGIRAVFMITILLNVNLAIFNLLPIPVLDGGQMLFATITKLRGRSLPVNVIAATQSAFMVLLLAMVAYVTIAGDVPRWRRDRAERASIEAQSQKK